MRAFLRPSSGEVNEPASSVEQPAESNARSSFEQPAETLTSIEAVNRWLKAQGEASSSPELQRLCAAVVVLASKPKARKEDVFPLCSSWNVRAQEKRKIGHFRR